jgi:hypothetical protein
MPSRRGHHMARLAAVGRDKASEARDKRHSLESFVAHSLGLCLGSLHVLCRNNHLTVKEIVYRCCH